MTHLLKNICILKQLLYANLATNRPLVADVISQGELNTLLADSEECIVGLAF